MRGGDRDGLAIFDAGCAVGNLHLVQGMCGSAAMVARRVRVKNVSPHTALQPTVFVLEAILKKKK